VFPNEQACLRLVSAILIEYDEEWSGGRVLSTIMKGSVADFTEKMTHNLLTCASWSNLNL